MTLPFDNDQSRARRGPRAAFAFVLGCRAPAHAADARVGILELDPSKTTIEFKLEGSSHTTHGMFRLKRGNIKANEGTAMPKAKSLSIPPAARAVTSCATTGCSIACSKRQGGPK